MTLTDKQKKIGLWVIYIVVAVIVYKAVYRWYKSKYPTAYTPTTKCTGTTGPLGSGLPFTGTLVNGECIPMAETKNGQLNFNPHIQTS